jgi:hypothetical protein
MVSISLHVKYHAKEGSAPVPHLMISFISPNPGITIPAVDFSMLV